MKNISKRKTNAKDNKRLVREVTKEFNIIVEELIRKNICLDYSNFSINECKEYIEITRNNRKNESNILYDTNKSVEEILDILLKKQEYNMLMFDKGIMQFELIVENGEIVKERFIYINKQNGVYGINEIKEMENDENNINWYEEITGIPVLIRMDYDKAYELNDIHPISHLTISNCECCRIPMKGPMSISRFINFILNMFYDEKISAIETNYDKLETLKLKDKDKLYMYWS